jgi:hypothetical protein
MLSKAFGAFSGGCVSSCRRVLEEGVRELAEAKRAL